MEWRNPRSEQKFSAKAVIEPHQHLVSTANTHRRREGDVSEVKSRQG
jgi:hypothetical protein